MKCLTNMMLARLIIILTSFIQPHIQTQPVSIISHNARQPYMTLSSEYVPAVENNGGVLSSSWPLKWPDEGQRRRRGRRVERKLGPRSRKLICFLRPLPSLRGRPHTARTTGALMWWRVHSMRLSSSAAGYFMAQETKYPGIIVSDHHFVENITKTALLKYCHENRW